VGAGDGGFSEFALRLRDIAASDLRSTRYFLADVTIHEVRLEGPRDDPSLVILLHTEDHLGSLYGLRAKVSEYHPDEGDPDRWAGYLHDQVMEAVDADPGLPDPMGAITWIDL
jgi:hypothetical protein